MSYGKPSAGEVIAGCLGLAFKVVLSVVIFFGTLALLGHIAGETLHAFNVNTGFWTQLGLVFVPEGVIALGVGSALAGAGLKK